jgi:hypothetical protein
VDEGLFFIRGLELNMLLMKTAAGGGVVEENIRLGIENINVVLGRLEGKNILERGFTCNYRTLYEVVMISLKNKLMEVQGRIKSNNSKVRDDLIKRCEYMARKFGEQSVQADDCRAELLRYDDVNLKMRAGKYREFLEKNNAKATRAFCRLNKEGGCNDDVTQIRDDNNVVFNNNTERGKYIGGFYSNLFKKKIDNLLAIEDFLSAECCDSEWVREKKLTEQERAGLEGEVTLQELSDALENSNFNSASGWDGLSFKVIRKFWGIVGPLMLKMTRETFLTGELTETFKMGLVKLIPKKGNAHKISDWRPITLLCCGYKLISGVVAKRLEKYLMKIIGRAQKGFLKEKNINTCTLNIMNCISQSWKHFEPMGVLCVDFSKALDSVEHEAVRKILQFFNFGPVMVGMVMTLLNGRKARVIMEGGYSENIYINRGTPQGDKASPYIFIIVIEVLLIKVRSMEGKGIDECDFISRAVGRIEIEKLTAEAYADDLTLIFKMSERAIEIILEILKGFEMVSGLSVNTNKTQLMVCGIDAWDNGEIIHGIEVVDSIRVLGIYIDRKINELNRNWDESILKMRRYCLFWGNFGLSISGRLMAAKTYILSQAIYLMGVLPLTDEKGAEINDIIANFVKGRGRILERSRQTVCEELGGYGIIDVRVLNKSVKSTWIKRWYEESKIYDYPMVYTLKERNQIVDRVGNGVVDNEGLPVLSNIIECWSEFKDGFYNVGKNIRKAIVFENDVLGEDRQTGIEGVVFGRRRYTALRDRLKQIRIEDITNDEGQLLTMVEINGRWGLNINWAEYFRLREEVGKVIERYSNTMDEREGRELNDFISSKKKGCKRYRMILVGRRTKWYEERDPKLIASAITLWGRDLDDMSRTLIELNFGAWGIMRLDSGFKEFLFKLTHGRLYLNQALANFTDVQPACTFCSIACIRRMKAEGLQENTQEWINRLNRLRHENVQHLFWECEHVRPVINKIGLKLTGLQGVNFKKKEFFGGLEDISIGNMRITILLVHFIKYQIYLCKCRNRIPTVPQCMYELEGLVRNLARGEVWREQVEDIPELVARMME